MKLRTIGLRNSNEGWIDIGVLMSDWSWFNEELLLLVEKDNMSQIGLICFWFGKDNRDEMRRVKSVEKGY